MTYSSVNRLKQKILNANPPFKLSWRAFLLIIAACVATVIAIAVGTAVVLQKSSGNSSSTGGGNSAGYQFTPDQAEWSAMNSLALAVSTVEDHSPDGTKWANFPPWNGTVFNLTGMTESQVQSNLCVGGILRGTKELYYEKPFADARAPTKAEVDDLHIRTIRHLRRMVGVDSVVPITFDRCLCSIALWSQELQATTNWDTKYPNAKTTNCFTGGHCNFTPDAADQALTFNGDKHNQTCTTAMSGAEGIGGSNANIPWSLKFHRTICQFLAEGTVGHAGPLFRREKLCPNFYYSGSGNGVTVRIKAGGKLYSKLYFDP